MPPPATAEFESRTLVHAGGRVQSLRAGDGPAVVVVHASGMFPARYARLAARWTDRYTVHAPHLVGYGDSGPFDPETWTPADDVAAVCAVLDTIGEPVHLVGHSYGGWIALQVARIRAVRSLGLYEPTVFGLLHEAEDGEGLADLAPFYADPWFLDPAHGGTDPWLGAFVDYWNQVDFWQVMGPEQRAPLQAVGQKVFAEVRTALGDRTGRAAWADLGVPTRLVHGARTTAGARRASGLLLDALPHADAVEIPRAGHLAPLVRVGPIGAAFAEHFARCEDVEGC